MVDHDENEGERSGVFRGNRQQISLTLPLGMVPKIDRVASDLGISRAAWINMTLSRALQTEPQQE